MATLPNGLFGRIEGVEGSYKFRAVSGVASAIYPRTHHDRKSPAQIEQRRRFRAIQRFLHPLYLQLVKPYVRWRSHRYTRYDEVVSRTLLNYDEFYGIPNLLLYRSSMSGYFHDYSPMILVPPWHLAILQMDFYEEWEPTDLVVYMVGDVLQQRMWFNPVPYPFRTRLIFTDVPQSVLSTGVSIGTYVIRRIGATYFFSEPYWQYWIAV